MQTLKATAIAIRKLHGIVLKPPFSTLKSYRFVDLYEELRNGKVFGGSTGPNEFDFGDCVSANEEPQPNVFQRHCGGCDARIAACLEMTAEKLQGEEVKFGASRVGACVEGEASLSAIEFIVGPFTCAVCCENYLRQLRWLELEDLSHSQVGLM